MERLILVESTFAGSGNLRRAMKRCCRSAVTAVAAMAVATATAAAAPVVYWSAEPVAPGESVFLLGSGFSEKMLVSIAGGGQDRGRAISNFEASESTACVPLPANEPAGVITLRLATVEGDLEVRINLPQPWWAQADNGQVASLGGWIRVFGRCMAFPGSQPKLQLRQGDANIDVAVVETGPWTVAGRVPPDAAPGEWRVWVHNGTGGEDAWADAGAVRIATADTSGQRPLFAVTDFGAIPDDDGNDSAAIQATLSAAANKGGGIVTFPRGRFVLAQEIIVPAGVTFRGAGMDVTQLVWGDSDEPPAALISSGGSNVSIEDLGIYAHNYIRGISVRPDRLPDGQSGPRPHNVRLRRLRLRLTPLSRKGLTDEQNQARRAAFATKVGVHMYGDNLRMIDCDIAWPTHLGFTMQGNDLLCRNNVARAENGGWCPIGGGERAIIEGNRFSGITTGITRGAKVWFANNVIEHQYAGFREGFTTDGTYGGPGFVKDVKLDGPRMTFKTTQDRSEPSGIPAAVRIVEGKGAGQTRMIQKYEPGQLQLDRPFDVTPDDSSLVWLANALQHHIIFRNTVSDTGIAVQLFGGALDCVVAENVSMRSGGFRSLGDDMCWHIQFLGNTIAEGLGTAGPEYQAGRSFIGAIGPWVQDYKGTTSRGIVMRNNRLENNSALHLRALIDGALLEGNTVLRAPRGIDSEITEWQKNVFCRNNFFQDVDVPLSPPDIQRTYRMLPASGGR